MKQNNHYKFWKMKNLSLIIIFVFSISSCGLQQNLRVSYRLTPNMTKSEVEKIMGITSKKRLLKKC